MFTEGLMANSYFLALLVSLLIQLVFFIFAFGFKTDKLTDLSYGLTFMVISLILLWLNNAYHLHQVILVVMVIVWGLRLTVYLFRRILVMGKDKRFDKMRNDLLKFGGFWLFQGLSVWIIILPVIAGLTYIGSREFGIWSFMGLIIWLGGLLIEAIADQQKFAFKSKLENKDRWIESGLWKYSRHPNYFGEILCWVGVFVYTLPLLEGWSWLVILSPMFIAFILLFVSGIPPLEKRYDKKYGDKQEYLDYKRKTSLIVPLPPGN